MNKEKQIIAIAKACGFSEIRSIIMPTHSALSGKRKGKNEWIADYTSDLNAMHEVEEYMWENGGYVVDKYQNNLSSLCGGRAFKFCHAPAHKKAEAFLKAFGLWEEEL
jgi:hypothetical protein